MTESEQNEFEVNQTIEDCQRAKSLGVAFVSFEEFYASEYRARQYVVVSETPTQEDRDAIDLMSEAYKVNCRRGYEQVYGA